MQSILLELGNREREASQNGSQSTTSQSSTLNAGSALSEATKVNENSKKGDSTVNPLAAQYQSKAGRYKSASKKAQASARTQHGIYQQAKAEYERLIGAFNDTDYFNYFLAAQEPRGIADQAYSQYRYFQNQSREYQRQYEKYNALSKTAK